MNDVNARDAKLIQYLNEAYGKERQLQTALEAHIQMTTRAPYKKRLQEHLRETKTHAQAVERRIKQLGGSAEATSVPGPSALSDVATAGMGAVHRAAELARGPLHAIRGTGEQEKMLKNAKTEFSEEHEEIANYTAIEALASSVGDSETARVARDIRREEERMASFLERLIPQLTTAVVKEEIPAELRNGTRTRRRSPSGTRRTAQSRGRSAARSSGRGSTSRSGASSRASGSSRRSGSARSASGRSSSGRSASGRASSGRSTSRRSTSARSTSGSSSSGRATSNRSAASRSGAARSASRSSAAGRAGGSRAGSAGVRKSSARRGSSSAAKSVARAGIAGSTRRAAAPAAAAAARSSGDTGTKSTDT